MFSPSPAPHAHKNGQCDRCRKPKRSAIPNLLFAILVTAIGVSVIPRDAQAQTFFRNPKICDTIKTISSFTLVFNGVTYDTLAGTSKWDYTLTWDGTPPGLSHFDVELCPLLTDANVVTTSPPGATVGLDGSTGLYSIKWDNISGFPANTPVMYSFTLDGLYELASTKFAPKAGPNSNLATICGPSIECEIAPPCEFNTPPVSSCPDSTALWVCDLSTICIKGFSCSDIDGNLDASLTTVTVNGNPESLLDDSVCFTPVNGANIIVLTCEDSCGVTAVCTTVVNVTLDVSPPQITCPGPITVQCIGDVPNPDTSLVTAIDSCDDGPVKAFVSDVSDGQTCPETITRTYKVTDACGNMATCTQTITVNDTIPPVITCPDNVVFDCVMGNPGTATATDNCGVEGITSEDDTTSARCPLIILRTWIATDSCGNADSCVQSITVQDLEAPILGDCPSDTTILCGETVPGPANVTATDNCDNSVNVDFSADTTSAACSFTIVRKWIATDSCDNADTCMQTIVVFDDTTPPVISCPADVVFDCVMGDPGTATATDNCGVEGITSEDDTTSARCPLIISRTWIATDSCGNADTCVQSITVQDIEAPVLVGCPNDTTILWGETVPGPANVTATDNCSASVDFSADTTSAACSYTIVRTWIATDTCGNADTCAQTIVVVDDTIAPVIACPADVVFDCVMGNPGTATATDNCDPNPIITSSDNIISSRCPLIILRTWIATDSCGNADSCVQSITVQDTAAPIITSCAADTMVACEDSIVFTPPTATDNCGPVDITIFSDVITQGTAPGEIIYTRTWAVTDTCGNTNTSCDQSIKQICDTLECPKITIVQADSVFQGQSVCLSITSEGSKFELGGFDFMIAYDQSALTALNAMPGAHLVNCGWEYFSYRFGPFGNCNVGCPSGLLKILAVAETNDGDNHPSCFGPQTDAPIELAKICFLVSNDRTLECQFARVRFFWTDCTDNVLTDKTGDTLLVSRDVFKDQNPDPITDGTTGFPTETGIQEICFEGLDPNKPTPKPCVDFYNGGVRIICADEIDDRGDLNLNGLANEIADVVVYTSYFIEGLAAFKISVEGQIAASDVNADGVVLSVADLVYQIRIVTGDVLPIPKLTHFEKTATFSSSAGVISTDISLGAVLFTFEGEVNVDLLAGGVEMETGIVDGNTRVLIYSMDKVEINAGALIAISDDILEIEAADYFGSALNVAFKVTPTDFALHQNYPNPFNPATKIAFDLPVSSSYVLSVYNITGQKIAEFTGVGEPGTVIVEWDASDVSSGVYFYRLEAGAYAATKKMVLLK